MPLLFVVREITVILVGPNLTLGVAEVLEKRRLNEGVHVENNFQLIPDISGHVFYEYHERFFGVSLSWILVALTALDLQFIECDVLCVTTSLQIVNFKPGLFSLVWGFTPGLVATQSFVCNPVSQLA